MNYRIAYYAVLLIPLALLAFGTGVSFAAGEYTPEMADSFYRTQDWPNAAKAYKVLTRSDSTDAEIWFRLGLALHHLQKYEDAIEAYKNADSPGSGQKFARYNIACSYALMGDKDKAFQWLDKSLEAGLSDVIMLNNDTDLVSLRADSQFAQVLLRADRNARPCQYDEEYGQLDFWLGEWNVYNRQDQKVGLNVIEKELEGCLIREKWTSRNGYQGSSINYYDPSSGKWIQHWVDEAGGVIRYAGELKDSIMYFEGESISAENERELSRMTLTPVSHDIVEQLIEHSRDDGETWYVWFYGIYMRNK